MQHNTYQLKVYEWEFFISADYEEQAIEKVNKYLNGLFMEDGFSVHAHNAKEAMERGKFEIKDYTAFIVV